jgi:hypothetical protein
MIQSLESRCLFSATPSQAVLDATAKVVADKAQIVTDLAAFHAGIALANSALATAKSTALAAIRQELGSGLLGGLIGGIVNTALAVDRQALKDAVTAHTAALKANVATWKAVHTSDLATLHTDLVALKAAKAAH